MKREMAALGLALLLCGLTACGSSADKPPDVSAAPDVETSSPPVQEPDPAPVETPEETETPAIYWGAIPSDGSIPTGERVGYYESPLGFMEFSNEDSFLRAFGFEGVQPFYEYSHTDQLDVWSEEENDFVTEDRIERLSLYYNEETGAGCGIEDSIYDDQSHKWGFMFHETELAADDEWGRWIRWEMDPFSIPGLEAGKNSDGMKDYQEHSEYDEKGRLTSFRADGIFPSPWSNEDGRNPLASAHYTYGENGKLRQREIFRNDYVFGSYQMSQDSWYDELGRVCYESCYVTHGEEHYYYIYTDDGPTPAYCLYIDRWGNGTHFAQY